MKIYTVIIIMVAIGCNSQYQTDYRWIRSYSESTIQGATSVVKDKGNLKTDVEVLSMMKNVNRLIGNTIDSISILTTKEVLERASSLIDKLEYKTSRISQFYNISEQSAEQDLELQLALLEFELLDYYVKRIGLMDITFDRLELRFIPKEVNGARVTGELLFAAGINNLENGAKMFVNNKEIPISGRVGLVELSTNELIDGKLTAKITFDHYNFEFEEEIEIR